MYNYTIQQPRMPDLAEAYLRGLQIRNDRQDRAMRQRAFEIEEADHKRRIEQEALMNPLQIQLVKADIKRARNENAQAILDRKANAEKINQSDINRKIFVQSLESDPLKRRFGIEQIAGPMPRNKYESGIPIEGSPEQLRAYALGPEEYTKNLLNASGASDIPMDVRTFEYWQSLSPDEQEDFFKVKRAQQIIDLGGTTGILNPITNEVGTQFTKTPKPLEGEKLTIDQEELRLKQEEAGRKADDALKKHNQFKLAKEGELSSLKEFAKSAKNLSTKNLGLNYGIGKYARIVPGSDAANVNAQINKLVSSGVIQVMAKMKAESPTGATGFGALSEREMDVLKNSFSILADRNISPKLAKEELENIHKIMNEYMGRIEKNSSLPSSGQNKNVDPRELIPSFGLERPTGKKTSTKKGDPLGLGL